MTRVRAIICARCRLVRFPRGSKLCAECHAEVQQMWTEQETTQTQGWPVENPVQAS